MNKKSFMVIFAIIVSLFVNTCSFGVTFSDLSESHWAYSNVMSLVESGVINGYPDGTYKPESTVSRAEFIKLIMVSLYGGEEFFSTLGVRKDLHWAFPYLLIAADSNYLMDGGIDSPLDVPITRLEMAHMLAKIIIDIDATNFGEDKTFSDISELDEVSAGYIAYISLNGLINGYPDGTFGPERTMTRAECATVIKRFIDIKGW